MQYNPYQQPPPGQPQPQQPQGYPQPQQPFQGGPQPAVFPGGAPPQRPEANAAAVFANLGAAQASKSSNWVRPGDYLVKIEGMKLTVSKEGSNVCIVECLCLHVFSDEAATRIGQAGHVVGEQFAVSYSDKHLSFLGNVKAMVAGLEGIPGEQIDAALAQGGSSITQHAVLMCGPEQPYAGMFAHLTAMQILTRRQTPFTKTDWHREVRPSELQGILSPEEMQRFFPGDALQRLLETEQKVHGGAPPQQQPVQQRPPAQQQPQGYLPQQQPVQQAPQTWQQPQGYPPQQTPFSPPAGPNPQ